MFDIGACANFASESEVVDFGTGWLLRVAVVVPLGSSTDALTLVDGMTFDADTSVAPLACFGRLSVLAPSLAIPFDVLAWVAGMTPDAAVSLAFAFDAPAWAASKALDAATSLVPLARFLFCVYRVVLMTRSTCLLSK